MPDPALDTTFCTGATCSVTLGLDPTDIVNPNQLLAVVNHDSSLECTDDLNLHVNRVGAPAPISIGATDNASNLIRQATNGDGLIVFAPKVNGATGGGDRKDIPTPVNALSDVSKTVTFENTDTVPRLFTIRSKSSVIVECGTGDADDTLVEVAVRSTLAVTPLGGGTILGEGPTAERVITLQMGARDGSNAANSNDGKTLNDCRDICDEILLDPGASATVEYQSRTIVHMNAVTNGTNRGFAMLGHTLRAEQIRG